MNKSITKENISQITLTLLIFSVPLNIAYHFCSDFAYVDGYFVNYLDFLVHVLDLAVIGNILWQAFLLRPWENPRQTLENNKLLILATSLTLALWGAQNIFFRDPVVFYASTRILLHVICALLLILAKTWQKSDRKFILWAVVISAVIQSILAVLQFALNHSLGLGIIGESQVQVGGFASSSVYLGDSYHLRGYGTFPHPNVLGGFLAVSLIPTFASIRNSRMQNLKKRQKTLLAIATLTILAGILVTWSRSAWVITAAISITWIIHHLSQISRKQVATFVLLGIILSGLLFTWIKLGNDHIAQSLNERIFEQSTAGDISITQRQELNERAIDMIKKHPVTGVGTGRFIPELASDPVYTESGIRLMQPVHNIFLLIWAETGTLGLVGILGLAILSIKKLKINPTLISSAIVILIAGSLDHYLWTLPQGMGILLLLVVINRNRFH